MGELGRDKARVFEAEEMEKRQRIEADIKNYDALLESWDKGERATLDCLADLEKYLEDGTRHPVSRLSAYERIARLTERFEIENKQVVMTLLQHVFTEPREEMQNAMLGILGTRLDQGILQRPLDSTDLPPEIVQQTANTAFALVNEIRTDDDLPAEYRDFAKLVVGYRPKDREQSELWQRMLYMAALYRGNAENLWPTLPEKPVDPTKPTEGEYESLSGMQAGRRLLQEGHVPSVEKELQAKKDPRRGSGDAAGVVTPLRIYVTAAPERGAMLVGSFGGDQASHFIAQMRRASLRWKNPDAKARAEEKKIILAAWKSRFWEQLPEKDRAVFPSTEAMTLRIETLFNEDALGKLLKQEYGESDPLKIDPSGVLNNEIDKIIESGLTDDEMMREIKKLIESRKRR